MITVSHNEIIVACRKSFEALGFSHGEAEDGANAIGWLAVHGLPLPNDFLSRLDTLKPTRNAPLRLVSEQKGASIWDAKNASGLSCFPNLADYASVKVGDEGGHQLIIQNMADIDLIWPYLVRVHRRGYHIVLRWGDSHQIENVVAFAVGRPKPECFLQESATPLAIADIELNVSQTPLKHRQSPKDIRIDTPVGLQNNYLDRTQNGIDIDSNVWEKLNLIGKQLLVESTAESEKRGAGGV